MSREEKGKLEQNATLAENLEKSKQKEEDTRAALQTSQEAIAKTEHNHMKQIAAEVKKQQELQMRASGSSREVDLLKNAVRSLKGQLQQLQELLVSKEQDHRKALEGRFARGSPEMETAVRQEVERLDQAHQRELEEQKHKVDTLSKQYDELEDEFRLALRIEASRFNELQDAYQKMSQDSADNNKLLTAAQGRDEKMSGLVAELTAMVKEQKGRITELSKSKQEMSHHYKERVTTLEAHLTEARRRMVSLELLKKDKAKLEAEVQALGSVVEGLKAERKLWGQELAQQGASLSQDRGRLESRIEILTGEVASLKKQLQSETDAVRIKAKMIEDQTETIRKLKGAVRQKDEESQQATGERLAAQRDLEEQLATERSINLDLQEKQDRLRDRKDELKQQVSELEEQLEQSRKAHSILNQKWKEKSSVIGQLEKQVTQMKDFWSSKEVKLSEERDKAVGEAREALEKLRSVDDAFRHQLDLKEENHRRQIEEINGHKQEEVDTANKHVLEVEEEMRMLLRETDSSRRLMEEKVKKLSKAFTELQSDVC
ncbi:Leucine-rich repeat and coiled-coil domain-containing protein 1 [Lamellibrachia satsuma]|nr:Leucine-rich repeat and coiled-coil domain-containing protein 1 [Lamellibrachia satsuma]